MRRRMKRQWNCSRQVGLPDTLMRVDVMERDIPLSQRGPRCPHCWCCMLNVWKIDGSERSAIIVERRWCCCYGDVQPTLSWWTEHWDSTPKSNFARSNRCWRWSCCYDIDVLDTSSLEDNADDCRLNGCCCIDVEVSDEDDWSCELLGPVVMLGGSSVPAGVEESRLGCSPLMRRLWQGSVGIDPAMVEAALWLCSFMIEGQGVITYRNGVILNL